MTYLALLQWLKKLSLTSFSFVKWTLLDDKFMMIRPKNIVSYTRDHITIRSRSLSSIPIIPEINGTGEIMKSIVSFAKVSMNYDCHWYGFNRANKSKVIDVTSSENLPVTKTDRSSSIISTKNNKWHKPIFMRILAMPHSPPIWRRGSGNCIL